MALLQRLDFEKSDPDFFNYIWKRVTNKPTLKLEEFIDLFDKPKIVGTGDAEEMA